MSAEHRLMTWAETSNLWLSIGGDCPTHQGRARLRGRRLLRASAHSARVSPSTTYPHLDHTDIMTPNHPPNVQKPKYKNRQSAPTVQWWSNGFVNENSVLCLLPCCEGNSLTSPAKPLWLKRKRSPIEGWLFWLVLVGFLLYSKIYGFFLIHYFSIWLWIPIHLYRTYYRD